ncbi:MAG: hypothetical protein IKG56_02590 [Clostridia bacterium]|nr:hypothetical protein [Clostridia bacterium]
MFVTYRSEDNPSFPAVAEEIARFMSEKLGMEVPANAVKWEACMNAYSLYSAIFETTDGDITGIMVKKTGEVLEVVEI